MNFCYSYRFNDVKCFAELTFYSREKVFYTLLPDINGAFYTRVTQISVVSASHRMLKGAGNFPALTRAACV